MSLSNEWLELTSNRLIFDGDGDAAGDTEAPRQPGELPAEENVLARGLPLSELGGVCECTVYDKPSSCTSATAFSPRAASEVHAHFLVGTGAITLETAVTAALVVCQVPFTHALCLRPASKRGG